MWAVVGLGNPGKLYSETRHNAGFALVKRMAREWQADLRGKRYQAKTAEVEHGGDRVFLALPQTYMNNSGLSVRDLLKGKRVEPGSVLIIYDDLDIPIGDIRVRKQGTAGTHKGMQSIVQETGSTRFPRIRIGIGPLPPGREAADFVLSRFTRSEKALLAEALDKAREALLLVLDGRIDQAMTAFN
ncbi:MAG: aminoacyl-tRNA hydrolase [Candidatus Aminicenantes bacterium]|nr:aminoacyl-tRNA hydrolase [Candidatus Aminicenantes bacterium]